MSEHPVTLDDLRARYGESWEIRFRPAGIPVVTAERCSPDGRHVKFIVTHSVAELAVKLATAGTAGP